MQTFRLDIPRLGCPRRHVLAGALCVVAGLSLTSAHAALEPALGEVMMHAFPFAPKDWTLTNGQLLPTDQNTTLFSLLGTSYGGNGSTTFALPDLRGRSPRGAASTPGSVAGSPSTYLASIPGQRGTQLDLTSMGVLTSTRLSNSLAVQTLTRTALTGGSGQPVSTRPPSLGIQFSIALTGYFGERPCMVGEVMLHAGTSLPSPQNMEPADGRILPIQNHTALYSILGTTYGGNGSTTFAVPNLNGRIPIGQGSAPGAHSIPLGAQQGSEQVSLTQAHTRNMALGRQFSLTGPGVATSSRSAANVVELVRTTTPLNGASTVSLPILPPVQDIRYYICANGYYPPRN